MAGKNFNISIRGKNVDMSRCGPGMRGGGAGGAVYGLGFIGALVYYISTAPDIVAGLVGIVKAIFWPAFVTYGLLKLLGM